MTCIVAIGDGTSVVMGGDSAAVCDQDITLTAHPKVFAKGGWLIGYTWSFRMGQLLEHAWEPPRFPGGSVHGWLCTDVMESLRTLFESVGFGRVENAESKGGQFLLGWRGRVYRVGSDYSVIERDPCEAAVGCGEGYALGALHATRGQPPYDRIASALAAAEEHSTGVAGPFTILEGAHR